MVPIFLNFMRGASCAAGVNVLFDIKEGCHRCGATLTWDNT